MHQLKHSTSCRSFSQLLSDLLASVEETASLSREAESRQEIFAQFAAFLEKLTPILKELKENEIMDTQPIRKAVKSLEAGIRRARILVRNFNSEASLTTIEEAIHDLGRCLGLVLLASLDVSVEIKEKIGVLHKEMLNVKFLKSSDAESIQSSCSDAKSTSISEIEDANIFDIEEIVSQLKIGSDEKLTVALSELRQLTRDQLVSNDWIIDNGIISALLNRMATTKHEHRLPIILVLRSLAAQNDENKEKMADTEYLTTVVKSLSRDAEVRREAVGLLLTLSEVQKVRRRIGKVQGCIVMLVSLLNGEDPCASSDAAKVLNALSNNTQNVLHMAEAGYFKPLVQYFHEGTEMNKILLATALSRMELTDQYRAALGEQGAIEPLVQMFISGKLEAKLSALTALQNLSSLTENAMRLIGSGIVSPLLQLLFSVTSVLMTLREPASAILASIAQSDCVLVNKNVAQQMLSLLNLSSPVIQYHLLRALNNMISHSSATKIRAKMNKDGAIQLLLPFLTEVNTDVRTAALNFLSNLSKDSSADLVEQLGSTYLNIIINIVSSSTTEFEKAAALGIISNLPVHNKQATEILRRANLLPILISLTAEAGPVTSTPTRSWLLESMAGALIRFTVSSDKKIQRYAAELGVIPCLVKLLSTGSLPTKARAATSLAQLSQNSLSLSKAKSSRWSCVSSSSAAFCEVHDGHCFVKSTFCLVKSGAISPLVQILDGKEREADEAVLSALATLLQDEIWENGSKAIEKESGVVAIVKVLEVGSGKALEIAAWMLERIFRTENFRSQYGEVVEALLIDLAQKRDPTLKPTIAKILAHLQLLPMQSSYF
ncbi:U-box domain-containing protein 44-like isoform X1 [Aristolochia californica]|uniref:U-box domain-containing protein 44-like isoform X1 n=1 Tax=Aristolochia californica TaxID=171875 RepID=UPI0035E390CA